MNNSLDLPEDLEARAQKIIAGIKVPAEPPKGKSFKEPERGGKVKFRGANGKFWLNDVVKNSEQLVVGETYTVAEFKIFSSWIRVELVEFPGLPFNFSWFET